MRCGLTNSTDRKSTRLNSSHHFISYAVFCLKKETDTPGFMIAARVAAAATDTPAARDPPGAGGTRCDTAQYPRGLSGAVQGISFFLRIGRPRRFSPFPHPNPFHS